MSTTAIALAADYAKFQELIETSDDLTPEMIADTLEGIEGALGDKLDGAFTYVRNLEGLAKTVDEEVKRLTERKKSFENRAKSIRKYVLSCLLASGQDSLKTTTNTFTARKGVASIVIDNIELLPDELVTTQVLTAPDKKAIKEAIENGVEVAGAHIEIGERSLQVR
ncbi:MULTISPECIES: siphovirus Gp157 family protein [Serratia]|uniref:siphovirus Gp157 family protein n=1 Tax=Serratia TaxID=613 RepID=UPI00077C2766|nr:MULTISPECIES: siphovirus Gp157 family protein [Serratia]CAI0724380.1 Siphovirus Gp157 [Serratia quinivorans]CAI0729047.1 Siphovirus Gp157 [Serratia grimesii]CAI2445094.1 Siphovirus Gp157 [Serratia grimesii]SUI32664.1 Siphovirus Gp157 [Serratia grimesii]